MHHSCIRLPWHKLTQLQPVSLRHGSTVWTGQSACLDLGESNAFSLFQHTSHVVIYRLNFINSTMWMALPMHYIFFVHCTTGCGIHNLEHPLKRMLTPSTTKVPHIHDELIPTSSHFGHAHLSCVALEEVLTVSSSKVPDRPEREQVDGVCNGASRACQLNGSSLTIPAMNVTPAAAPGLIDPLIDLPAELSMPHKWTCEEFTDFVYPEPLRGDPNADDVALLSLITKAVEDKDIGSLDALWRNPPEKQPLGLVAWKRLIAAYGKLAQLESLRQLSKWMPQERSLFNELLRTFIHLKQPGHAWDVIQCMAQAGVKPDLNTFHLRIALCAQERQWSKLAAQLQEMKAVGIVPTVNTLFAMANACISSGQPSPTVNALRFIKQLGAQPNLEMLLIQCCTTRQYHMAKHFQRELNTPPSEYTAATWSLLIEAYCGAEDIDGLLWIQETMAQCNVIPLVPSFQLMLSAAAKSMQGDVVISIWDWLTANIQPTWPMYLIAQDFFVKTKMTRELQNIVHSMLQHRKEPSLAAVQHLAEVYEAAGRLPELKELANALEELRWVPDDKYLNTLACAHVQSLDFGALASTLRKMLRYRCRISSRLAQFLGDLPLTSPSLQRIRSLLMIMATERDHEAKRVMVDQLLEGLNTDADLTSEEYCLVLRHLQYKPEAAHYHLAIHAICQKCVYPSEELCRLLYAVMNKATAQKTPPAWLHALQSWLARCAPASQRPEPHLPTLELQFATEIQKSNFLNIVHILNQMVKAGATTVPRSVQDLVWSLCRKHGEDLVKFLWALKHTYQFHVEPLLQQVIVGLVQGSQAPEAVMLLEAMHHCGIPPNDVMYDQVLCALFAKRADLHWVQRVLATLNTSNPPRNTHAWQSLAAVHKASSEVPKLQGLQSMVAMLGISEDTFGSVLSSPFHPVPQLTPMMVTVENTEVPSPAEDETSMAPANDTSNVLDAIFPDCCPPAHLHKLWGQLSHIGDIAKLRLMPFHIWAQRTPFAFLGGNLMLLALYRPLHWVGTMNPVDRIMRHTHFMEVQAMDGIGVPSGQACAPLPEAPAHDHLRLPCSVPSSNRNGITKASRQRDAQALNDCLLLYTKVENFSNARKVLKEMVVVGVLPSTAVVQLLVQRLGAKMCIGELAIVVRYLRALAILHEKDVYSSVAMAFGLTKQLDRLDDLLVQMQNKGICKGHHFVSTIRAHLAGQRPDRADIQFQAMLKDGHPVPMDLLVDLVEANVQLGLPEGVDRALHYLEVIPGSMDERLCHVLLRGAAKSRHFAALKKLLDVTTSKKYRLEVATYNIVLAAYVRSPIAATVPDGVKWISSRKKLYVKMNAVTYALAIAVHCAAHDPHAVAALLLTMQRKKVSPEKCDLRSLCRLYQQPNLRKDLIGLRCELRKAAAHGDAYTQLLDKVETALRHGTGFEEEPFSFLHFLDDIPPDTAAAIPTDMVLKGASVFIALCGVWALVFLVTCYFISILLDRAIESRIRQPIASQVRPLKEYIA